MKKSTTYIFEYALVLLVIVLSISGFWNIFFGPGAAPTTYQILHVLTVFSWLFLLLFQLRLIERKRSLSHRKVGLSILFFGPLLFATTALLSVHSAHKGWVSGEGDVLLVQNVMGSLELGLIILLAFILRKRRAVHGAFILSTAILFMGIALFFTFLSFVPQFKIEGPETFYRFGTAAATGQLICLVIGILFFVKDWRNGWPYVLAALSFIFNHFINILLIKYDLIQPLTEFVGSLNQLITFFGSFVVLLILLGLMVTPKRRVARSPQKAEATA